MTFSRAETIVCFVFLTCMGFVRSQPLIIDENTAPGFVLLNKTCLVRPLVLENETAIPWKYFEVNNTSAPNYQITLKQSIDAGQDTDSCWPKDKWTSKGVYACDVKTNVVVDIRVGQVNNNFPPTFCNKSAPGCVNITSLQVSVKEDALQNSDIIKISMCDRDVFNSNEKPPTLTITSPFFSSGSEIKDSFKVLLNQKLDYEKATQHITYITVDDGMHPLYTMTLTVTVVDVDDQGPAFTSSVYHCNISEMMYNSLTTSGCVVQANDKDIGINATIDYEIIPSFTGKVQFSISNTGNIQVHGQLDRETMPTYILPVKGYQRNRKADRFDIATVIFEVTDINDNLPTFSTTAANISIIENSPVGTLVYQFTATDLDEGSNAIFTYRLVDSLGAFQLDTEGRLIVNDSGKLDREKQKTPFIITVYADPAGKALDSNPNATLTITLLDVNDNSPSFPQGSYETTIYKTHLVGTTILTLTASDPDLGPNGKIKYSWQEEPDESTFSLEVETGEVKLKRNLTEHFRSVYHLIVKAEDNATIPIDRRSSSVPLMIRVKDVNDHTPNIVILESKNISENAAPGTTVAWLTVTDEDPDDNLAVSITSGNIDGAFNITLAYPPVYMIRATRKLDRETHNMYHLTIICSDGIHISTSNVNILVLDENDNSPVIKGHRNFTTTENKVAGEHIGTITATDGDEGKNAALIFSIDPESPWNANFSLNSTSGLIRSTTSLDRDVLGNTDTIYLLAYAVDNGDIPLTGSAMITVKIHDLNDNAPVFEQANVTLTVNELKKPGLLYTTTATDLDLGENKKILFRVGKITPQSSSNLFELSTDGQLKNNRSITFDDSTDGVITIKVMAIDQGPHKLSSTQDITLLIHDVNNHVPSFKNKNYSVNINETSEPGSFLIRVSAIDMDISPSNNNITYWLNDTFKDTFRIDPTSGEVFLVKSVDLDVQSPRTNYTLEVFASDNVPSYNTGKIANTFVPLSVHVDYVNEYTPVFEKASYTCPVDENFNGPLNCFVQASDLDRGKDGIVHYDIINDNTQSTKFKVNNTTGQLYLLNSFDYENINKTEFNITISASDSGNPPQSTCSQVTIEVQNINDCTPRLTMRSSISISENTPLARGLPLLELAATDEDGDLNHLSYFIIPPSNIFSVHNDKTIILSGSLEFDYETQAQYQLNVVVSDSKFNSSRPFSIRVTSMNEFAPVFNQSYIFDVTENSVSHHSIQAVDGDKGGNDGFVSYTLDFLGNDDISRNINITKGGMLTISNLDRESVANVSFTVLAVDGGKLSLTGMTTIVININGTDDNPPYYTDDDKNITFKVDENRAYPNMFTSVALDKDVGVGSEISYRLLTGNTNLFSLLSDGQLSIEPLSLSDGEEIQIQAYNPTNKAHKATQRIQIFVQDVNDKSPVFSKSRYSINVSECSHVGAVLTSVHAVDGDINPLYNKVTYGFVNDTQDILSVNPITGELRLMKQLDYDSPNAQRHYQMQVFATDALNIENKDTSHTPYATVAVNVLDCNDNKPHFEKDLYWCSVYENHKGPFNCTVKATDGDTGIYGKMTYMLDNTTQGFTIDKDGVIKCTMKLDYESNHTANHLFPLNATASDTKYTRSSTILVELVNLNDEPPRFQETEYTFSVLENTNTHHLGQVLATDPDFDLIYYSIVGNCTGISVLANGTLHQEKPFDFELIQLCQMVVTANDSIHTVFVNVIVNIVDTNDNYPQFTNSTYEINIKETLGVGKDLLKISASDADGTQMNSDIKFNIINGNINEAFELNNTTGIIRLNKKVNASIEPIFILTVEANDGGTPSLSKYTVVTIIIDDVNDNPPWFLYTPYKVQVTENKDPATLLQIIAEDADRNDKLSFLIRPDTRSNYFTFDGNNLNVTKLDAEEIGTDNINIFIYVTDGIYIANTSVEITIIDENDNTPQFTANHYSKNLKDTSSIDTDVIRITAIDKDISNTEIMYFLDNGYGYFDINRASGVITLLKQLDVKGNTQFSLNVIALDSGSPPNMNETKVTVTVTETNKYTPVFNMKSPGSNTMYFNFTEETKGLMANLSAHDEDTGPAGILSYSIQSVSEWPNNFAFDNKTGYLSLTDSIDYESVSNHEFSFLVVAKDSAEFPKSASATVIIDILDVDEAPVLHLSTNMIYKELNASIGTPITTVTVSDPDKSDKFKNFSYAIEPSYEYFKIEATDNGKAIVETASTLSTPGTYNVTVTVTDGGGKSDSKNMSITISTIKGFELNTSLFENTPPPFVLLNILESTNMSEGTLFSIDSSTINDEFFILQNSSLVSKRTFDREMNPEFTFEIKGKTNLTTEAILTAQIQMHVTVLDRNDNPPIFNRTSYLFDIAENASNGRTVGTVTASDADENPKLFYSIDPPGETFTIQPFSGEILLQGKVDYETRKNYSFTINCNDTEYTNTTTVIVIVNDINDETPRFNESIYNFNITEGGIGPLPNIIVQATDPDTADQGQLAYSIISGDGQFGIEANGHLKLNKPLDYDAIKNKHLQLTVQVTDTANHMNTTTVMITVLDANDNNPNFTKAEYYYHVQEGNMVLENTLSVEASDKDSGVNSQLTFNLQNADASIFNITTEGNTGYIHILQTLDRESKSTERDANGSAVYKLTVVATDHGIPPLSATTLVHVTVDDVNDCPPTFTSPDMRVSVQEGTAMGTVIETVTTTDCDFLQAYTHVNYSLENDSSGVFRINSTTGDVILNKPVSVKENPKYTLVIVASDGKNKNKANLTVIVLDANDHSPTFTQPSYSFNVSENVASVSIGEVLAVDEDPGENGNVTYMITSGNVGDVFRIQKVNKSGLITVVSPLDREKITLYTLIVAGEDSAKTDKRQGTCTVTVHVDDLNDNAPVFESAVGYTGHVRENAQNGTQINLNTFISSHDKDNDINGTYGITYSILPTNQTKFCIGATTGVVTVCGALNREMKAIYFLEVEASDRLGRDGYLKDSTNLTITVTDVNDNPPVFVHATYTYSVPENATSGTSVGQVSATDADENGVQDVRLKISSGSFENFYIETFLNDSTLIGTLYVSGVLDREERSPFTLTLDADDKVQESNTTVIIIILDVNDNAPVFNESHIEVKVVEDSTPGIILTIAAYDRDEPNTNNSKVVFSFDQETKTEFGNYFGIFTNGSIFSKKTLDREKLSSFSLMVIARDEGQPPETSSTLVTVTVLDINDNTPQFCEIPPCSSLHGYIVDSQPVNSVIALPVATDPDEGNNGTIVYSILPSPASIFFKINNETGLIQISRRIAIDTLIGEGIVNATNNSNRSVTFAVDVMAKDMGPDGVRSSTLELLVTVEPINDNAPLFQGPCDFQITEEQLAGTFVGDCKAIIPNETYSHMSYTLIAGFDSDNFEINPINGTIRTKTMLDRERVGHYSLSVQVKDGRTPERTAFAAVTITVLDINDNQPEFYHNPIVLEIPEGSNCSRTINASASDPDAGNNGKLTYSTNNNYGDFVSGLFRLDNETGIVTVNGTFDYEQKTNYSFFVYAQDHGDTPKSSSVLVTIAIVDVNDNAPVFHNEKLNYSIQENKTGKMFALNATDKDSGYNGRVLYSLLDMDTDPFRVDPFTGWVYVDGSLDYEVNRVYNLSFEATDQGMPPLATTLNITVDIGDVYDYIPKFPKDVYEKSVNASTPVGTAIIDLGLKRTGITYSISGSDSGFFSVDRQTGVVTVKETLGLNNRHDLITITAQDTHGKKANCKVIIYINGHEVLFPEKALEVRIPENFNESTLLIDLNTTEELSGLTMLYTITDVQPPVNDVFHIVPETGEVFCVKALDREEHGEYNIYISALVSSSHRNKRSIDESSTTVKLTVHVDDENDNSPVFKQAQQSLFGVPADAKANFLVTELKAQDPDIGENGRIFYSAAGHVDVFGVDRETGNVKTLVAIHSTQEKLFRLNVTAYDGSGKPGPNSTLEMKIMVVPTSDRLVLQVNMSLEQFRQKQEMLISKMSQLLSVDVQLENTESHYEQTDKGTRLDLSRTDMFFYGKNKTTGAVVPFDVMMGLIHNAGEALKALFGNHLMDITHVKKEPHDDPSAITVPIIALFCVAIFIFVGTFIAIVMVLYSWSRATKQQEANEKQKQTDVKMSDFEMGTLRSHASGGATDMDGAVNPVFLETEFVESEKPKEKKTIYESQEIRIKFSEEPLRLTDEILNTNGARSVADSALENTSLASTAQLKSEAAAMPAIPELKSGGTVGHVFSLKAEEGPVMTSSPRISKDFDAEGHIVILGQGDDNRPTIARLHDVTEATTVPETDTPGRTDTGDALTEGKREEIEQNDGADNPHEPSTPVLKDEEDEITSF